MSFGRPFRVLAAPLAVAAVVLAAAAACVPPPAEQPAAPPVVTPPTLPGTSPGGLPNTPNGVTFLAGKPLPGTTYDGDASRVQISADGHWVVYHHGTENLVLTPTTRPPASCPRPARTDTQIYRTNLDTGDTELVSRALNGCYGNGESSFPDVSGDGRFVVFMSRASDLVAGDGAQQDVIVKDMQSGQTSIVNVASNGAAAAGGSSGRPDLSDDGSLIAYTSDATNLVPGDTNGKGDCFVTRRANLANVERASVGHNGQQLDEFSYRCQLTANGSAMVFASHATNATGAALSSMQRIYVRNRAAGTTTLVSRRANGQAASASRPDISANGACVTYQTTEAGVVAGDTDTANDVFLYDVASGQTRIISIDRSGNQVTGASTRIVVNADCSRVAFTSNSNKLVAEDRNGTRDTFMRDLGANTLFLISVNSAEQQAHECSSSPPTPTTTATTVPGGHDPTGAEDISTRPSISDDGLVVAYISDVCGLVPEEPQMNTFDGVIVRSMR